MHGGFDRERARTFVRRHGSPIEQARATSLLDDRPPAEAPPELALLQNPHGGFPFELVAGQPTTLNHTALVLRWLKELRQAESETAKGAFAYVLSRQTRRGIWREGPDIRTLPIPLWMDAESTAGDVYTTALCAGTLVGRAGAELALDRALVWLQPQQGRDGLLEGFKLPASWMGVPVFVEQLGHEARPTRRLVAGLGAALSPEWTTGMLAEMLSHLLDAGYEIKTEVVARAWEMLQTMQQPDGSFAAAEEEESAAGITLTALDVARRLADS